MNIPGTINPDFLANMGKKSAAVNSSISEMQGKVTGCVSCAELAILKDQIRKTITPELEEFKKIANAYYTDQLAQVRAAIAKLAPLIVNPTDLGSVIAWINNMITSIRAPYDNAIGLQVELLQKQAEMVSKLAGLTSAIDSLISSVDAKSSLMKCEL